MTFKNTIGERIEALKQHKLGDADSVTKLERNILELQMKNLAS